MGGFTLILDLITIDVDKSKKHQEGGRWSRDLGQSRVGPRAGHRHETRLERNALPDFAPSISTRREKIDNNGGSHRIHARSFRRRHSSGGLHAVLPGDRLCGKAHPTSLHLSSRSVVHSFQLRAYEQGTRARLIEAEDELRALRHERDDALRDLNACKDQTRTWVSEADRWKAEARPWSTSRLAHRAHVLTLHIFSRNSRTMFYYCL